MKKFILWDNDGVLVDTEYWYFKATAQALAELDIELTQTAYLTIMAQGKSSWELAHTAGIDASTILKKQSERNSYYQHYLGSEDIEIPGVIPLLEKLAQKHRMAIVTTSKRADFNLIHEGGRILEYMEFVLVREDYTHSKPNPEPYLKALNNFAASPDQALVIEDSERGLRAAIAAGIECAVVHNDFTKSHNFTGARHRIRTLSELVSILN